AGLGEGGAERRVRARAAAGLAHVGLGAGVAVVAGRPGELRVHAADGGVTGVGRADVAVVAVGRRSTDAGRARAGVVRRAGVPVRARGADRVDLAGRRAAVAVEGVAIVAGLGPVDVAVTANRHVSPADDRVELVGLHAAGGKTGPLDLENVRAAGAPGHGLVGIRVPDQPGCRRRSTRRVAEEGPHVAIE